ncbi:hypothetical protein CEXT_277431 [Caerostris extrusa]|uniref:Uncharacterized protein n=1 Tax=Caerostris extrusa TaxID=172846 RepID=A0AAV4RZ34_CAEEX|nr:hypothetical protein CEXT_277431 [Caerostris extrusa]
MLQLPTCVTCFFDFLLISELQWSRVPRSIISLSSASEMESISVLLYQSMLAIDFRRKSSLLQSLKSATLSMVTRSIGLPTVNEQEEASDCF